MATATSRLRFRWLAATTFVVTYSLIVLGAVVRVTESGDACPDWPRCKGELIPPLESAVLIEFSHRLLASIVGLLIVATAIFAWRWQKNNLVRWGAIAAVLLVGGQIVLGGLTVLNDLPPSMVTAHLALASALLATLLVITLVSFEFQRADSSSRQESILAFRNLAVIAALAIFALMLTGSYVTGSGAGLAIRDWPLFNGSLLPDGGRLAMIHATHRIAAVVVGLLIAHVAGKAWRSYRWHRPVAFGAVLALVLYVAQVFVGASNVWTTLQPAAGAVHLGLAVGLWVVLTGVAVVAHLASQPVSSYEEEMIDQPTTRAVDPTAGTMPAGGAS